MPVLTVDGEQLNDSSFIIKALNAKLQQAKGRYARSPSAAAAEEEERWFRHAPRGRTPEHCPRLTRPSRAAAGWMAAWCTC